MIDLSIYINNVNDGFKLTMRQKKELIELDRKFWVIAKMYHNDKPKYITNIDEEFDKFYNAYKKGEKYFPVFQFETPNKLKDGKAIKLIDELLYRFHNFKCFLSKYYLEILFAYKQMIKGMMDPDVNFLSFNEVRLQKPSIEMYELALKTIKKNPYKKIKKDSRNLTNKDAKKTIEDYLDELGWDWKVQEKDNLQPRMAVGSEVMSIKTNSTFSKIDLEGLKAHEVRGHVGRRYYALKTGLYLFVEGLLWRNTLDEGLAVWNSLHLVEKQKPNVLFNIALKTIIAYHLNDMDFYELFNYIHNLVPDVPSKIVFKTLVRFKRELQDCSIIGGNGDDQSYFCGYQIVKDMTDKEREDILKYNIGPDQIKDLPDIKKFFKLNKFESLLK